MNRLDAWWRQKDPKRFQAKPSPPDASVRRPLNDLGPGRKAETRPERETENCGVGEA